MNPLLKLIENLRVELYTVAEGKRLTDPAVLKISQHIDELLNSTYQEEKQHSNPER